MSRRINSLTGIRGIAALWVVAFHAANSVGKIFDDDLQQRWLVRSGYLAVDLFFLLSGFILAYTYHSRLAGAGRTELRRFFVARFFRLFPLNWATLAVLVIMSLTLPRGPWASGSFAISALLPCAALVQSWGLAESFGWNYPAWSLSTEWAACFLFPAIVPVAARWRHRWAPLAFFIGCFAVLAVIVVGFGHGTLNHAGAFGMPRCLLEFTMGVCLWRISVVETSQQRCANLLVVAGTLGLAFALVFPRLEAIAPLAFAALVLACAFRGSVAERMFGNNIVTYLGEISFSIYLSHAAVLIAIDIAFADVRRSAGVAEGVAMLAILVAVVAVSAVLWRWVELPGQALGRRLSRSPAARLS